MKQAMASYCDDINVCEEKLAIHMINFYHAALSAAQKEEFLLLLANADTRNKFLSESLHKRLHIQGLYK